MENQFATHGTNEAGRTLELYIKVAADNIAELRKVDVFRVLDAVRCDNIDGVTRGSLAAWIKTERPDLIGEVEETMSELLPSSAGKDSPVPLFARTVANALERHMNTREESRLHWAQPAGAESPWEAPKLLWPAENYPDLGYLIKQGSNEGYQVLITHQPEPRNCSNQQALIVIKCLCSHAEAFNQARLVMEFIEKMDTEALLKDQTARRV